MVSIKLQAFGGMIPAIDSRLLPPSNAERATNLWLYSGDLQGMRVPVDIHTLDNPAARYVYRVPKAASDVAHINDSYWLEFENINTLVVKSPLAQATDDLYYWANATAVPGYTTKQRLEDGDPALVLGVPAPSTAPTVGHSGGVGAAQTRAYVYTWVTEYGEEGPPSDPTTYTGKVDGTWAIGVTAPTVGDTTDRALATTNIYRTVTSAQGIAEYYFVATLPIATLSYNDTLLDAVVAAAGALESTYWTAPPTDLEGMVAMPNGMIAGWRENELWFCEPYRPHAWPPQYQIATEYPIVGMAAFDQTLIIGTEAYPYYATGVNPSAVTLRRIAAAEPCISRGSIVATAGGVFYASPNGLILAGPGSARNVTKPFITKDKWDHLLNLQQLRAALLNGGYYAYSGVQEGVFELTAFEVSAFQQEDFTGTRDGAFIEFDDTRIGVTLLQNPTPTYNVLQDPWTGEVLIVRDGVVSFLDVTSDITQGEYTWKSKIFVLPKPLNMAAVKVIWEAPVGVTDPTAVMRIYANGVLRMTRTLPADYYIFRLPSGFKATEYQFEVEGTLIIKSIELASSVKELASV